MEHKPVKSSNCESCAYDEATETLHVRFKNGGTYGYSGVPKSKYDELMSAPSFGSYLHKNVKGVHPHEKLSEGR